jgi:hypothetical protein
MDDEQHARFRSDHLAPVVHGDAAEDVVAALEPEGAAVDREVAVPAGRERLVGVGIHGDGSGRVAVREVRELRR